MFLVCRGGEGNSILWLLKRVINGFVKYILRKKCIKICPMQGTLFLGAKHGTDEK